MALSPKKTPISEVIRTRIELLTLLKQKKRSGS
jgi:hypothetical protein